MTDAQEEPTLSPFVAQATAYLAAGWWPLPLPARAKSSVPRGFTGHAGEVPSGADVQSWLDDGIPLDGGRSMPAGNIAIRLPHHVIGIDVDNYGDKTGALSLANLIIEFGAHLPQTWRTTSRDDGLSGIYLFTVPEGLNWPGVAGPNIEIIQFSHRYAVVWPSEHPEGGTYRWHSPDGAIMLNEIPQVDQLPALPEEWIAGLTKGELRVDVPRADLDTRAALAWLQEHGGGTTCSAFTRATERYVNDLKIPGVAIHPAATNATQRFSHMVQEGHPGGLAALDEVKQAYDFAIERDDHRGNDKGEWLRALVGAVRRAAVLPVLEVDPCLFPVLRKAGTTPMSSPAPTATAADTPSTSTSPSAPTSDVGASEGSDSTTDASDPPPAIDPMAQRRAELLSQEYELQRARREAKLRLDDEQAAQSFREPVWMRTLTDELALPDDPVRYAVDGVLPVGGNVLLTAQFKAGKTTMITNLARSMVDGQPFLNEHDIAGEHRVAIWNYEVGREQYRRWLRDAAIENTDRVTVLNLRGYRLPMVMPRIEDWIVNWLIDHRITCWIVDPFARAFVGSGTSENDNTEVGRFLDTLDVIKDKAGVSELIMPTHTGRGFQEVGAERARGATRLDDWADVRWLLTVDEEEGKRFFRATGRDVDVPEVEVGYDALSRRLHVAGAGRKRKASTDLGAEVMAFVRANPGATTRQIRDAVTGGTKAVGNKIDELVLAKRLRYEVIDKGGHAHYAVDVPAVLLVVPGPVLSGSSAVPPSGSSAPFRGRNHGGSELENHDEDDELEIEVSRPIKTREDYEREGRELRLRSLDDGTVFDENGEVL